MRIGIHHRKGSFSDRWIEYCIQNRISYKIVNCYDSNIIQQLEDCDVFLWHHHHGNYKDLLFAKQLLFALEQAGKKVFPDFKTEWHFDDKVGQKYILESIGAPLIPSYIFYSKNEALNWIKETSFPKVFKLRNGAGSANVQLVKTKRKAKKIVSKAFSCGFSGWNDIEVLKDRIRKYKKGNDTFGGILMSAIRLVIPRREMLPREKGYVYFQDFIPNNQYDIRVIVIGFRAFAIKRFIRKNDFRASGSGQCVYEKNEIPDQCVRIAFDISKSIKSQCMGYDFIFDQNGRPLLTEMGYGFTVSVYDSCSGYWDSNIIWHEGKFNPQEWMIDNLLKYL